MICSLQELGMEKKYIPEEYQGGIYYFTHQVTPGDDPLKELNFADEIMDLSVTPNRGDLMSMIGVAFEISAIFNRPLKKKFYQVVEKNTKTTDVVNVSIDSDLCSLYYAKAYRNVKIKKSPEWLTSRLIAFGVRPINNVVDITNYILALFGQPIHAFDGDKLGKDIKVRLAEKNEKIIACLLAKKAGADFVKTSTGFSTSGATIEDVKLMRHVVGVKMGVKASGGVRT